MELRDAVQARDEALATLGEATLAGATRTGRIAAFATTLAELDGQRAAVDRRRESLTIELAAVEADRRARLAEFDARLDGLGAELIPLERTLHGHRQRREALKNTVEDADDLQTSLEARRQQLRADAESAEEAATDSEELSEIERRLAELAESRPTHAAELAALDAPIGRLEAQVDELQTLRAQIGTQREAWLEEVDGRIAELTQQRDEERAALERSDARRRAALVDLGREALHLDGEGQPGDEARHALEHIVGLRRRRSALQASEAALDARPLHRTVLAVLVVAVVVVLLRGC